MTLSCQNRFNAQLTYHVLLIHIELPSGPKKIKIIPIKHIAILRFGFQIVFVCFYITPSHYHHCANFIWRQWTYKMPVRYNLSSVWVRSSIFSVSHYTVCGALCFLCVFSLPLSFVMIERIYILCLIIIIKSEVWTITHCLWLGHETIVCAVCLSILSCLQFAHCMFPMVC